MQSLQGARRTKKTEGPPEPKPLSAYRTHPDQIRGSVGLNLQLSAQTGMGKSDFIPSCPKPIHVGITDDTFYRCTPHYEDEPWWKEPYLNTYELMVLDTQQLNDNKIASLDLLEDWAYSLCNAGLTEGTVAVDTLTYWYQWLTAWKQQIDAVGITKHVAGKKITTKLKRSQKTGDILQTEWSHVAERFKLVMHQLKALPLTFVVTTQMRNVRDDKGNVVKGEFYPYAHVQAPEIVDFVLEGFYKVIGGTRQKWWEFTKIGRVKAKGETLITVTFTGDISFPRLIDIMWDEMGVKIKYKGFLEMPEGLE